MCVWQILPCVEVFVNYTPRQPLRVASDRVEERFGRWRRTEAQQCHLVANMDTPSTVSSWTVFCPHLCGDTTWWQAIRRVRSIPTTRSSDFQCALRSLSSVWIGLVITWVDGWNFILFFSNCMLWFVQNQVELSRHCSLNLCWKKCSSKISLAVFYFEISQV